MVFQGQYVQGFLNPCLFTRCWFLKSRLELQRPAFCWYNLINKLLLDVLVGIFFVINLWDRFNAFRLNEVASALNCYLLTYLCNGKISYLNFIGLFTRLFWVSWRYFLESVWYWAAMLLLSLLQSMLVGQLRDCSTAGVTSKLILWVTGSEVRTSPHAVNCPLFPSILGTVVRSAA